MGVGGDPIEQKRRTRKNLTENRTEWAHQVVQDLRYPARARPRICTPGSMSSRSEQTDLDLTHSRSSPQLPQDSSANAQQRARQCEATTPSYHSSPARTQASPGKDESSKSCA